MTTESHSRIRGNVALTALSCALAVAFTGCRADPGQACSDVGSLAGSGVSVDLRSVLSARFGPVDVRMCVDGQCRTRRTTQGFRDVLWFTAPPSLDGEALVEIAVRATAVDGQRWFAGSTEATPETVQPNGSGCPPTFFSVLVVARQDDGPGVLTQQPIAEA